MKIIPLQSTTNFHVNNIKKAKTVNIKHTSPITNAVGLGLVAYPLIKTSDKFFTQDIENKLLNHNYQKDERGNLVRKLSAEDEKQLQDKYGKYASDYKNLIETPVKPVDLKLFRVFMNIDKDISKKLYENNFENFFRTFLILKQNNNLLEIKKTGSDAMKCIEKVIENPKINKNSIESLMIYKADVYGGVGQSIQYAFEQKAIDSKFVPEKEIQQHIDNISSAINECDLPENLSLYRVERPRTNLRTAKQNDTDTINLSQMVVNASKSGDKNEINKVKEFILDNEITVTNPRFMSTSMNNDIDKTFNLFGKSSIQGTKILWKLKTEPNTKGLFIEAVNITGKDASQNEILLQKGSKMLITNVDYDEANKMWIFDAKVKN